MALLFIQHDRRLKVAKADALPPLPPSVEALSQSGTTVISCRSGATEPEKVLKSVNAMQRFPVLQGGSFHFHAVESDSPLAPLWLWDIVHACPVGSTLTFSGDDIEKTWLRRRYYSQCLEIDSAQTDTLTLRKVAPLPAERDAGLDGWSFCIPVGPGDPTQLNATVGRILELQVPDFEIILCGVPGDGFLYGDRVRIIGEDLPATPMIPGLKKNMMAEAASHGNLCILHDRVFLPSAFMRAIRAFGDMYPMTTFQSLYFDDRLNLDYRRYSDLAKIGIPKVHLPTAIDETGRSVSHFSPTTLATVEGSGFMYASALRYHRDRQYPTGSLYICKRSVWLDEPQSNSIKWLQYEDVEHGLRCSAVGIPARINPHAITQSLTSRVCLSQYGYFAAEDAGGRKRERRASLGRLPLPRKPLLRQSAATMSANLSTFMVRHSDDPPANPKWMRFTHCTTGRQRLRAIANALAYARCPLTESACRDMIRDYEKLILGDQLSYAVAERLVGDFRQRGPQAFLSLLTIPEALNQTVHRPGRNIFTVATIDFFPKRGLGLMIGSSITALILTFSRRPPVIHAGGFGRFLHDILDTTPSAGRNASSKNAK